MRIRSVVVRSALVALPAALLTGAAGAGALAASPGIGGAGGPGVSDASPTHPVPVAPVATVPISPDPAEAALLGPASVEAVGFPADSLEADSVEADSLPAGSVTAGPPLDDPVAVDSLPAAPAEPDSVRARTTAAATAPGAGVSSADRIRQAREARQDTTRARVLERLQGRGQGRVDTVEIQEQLDELPGTERDGREQEAERTGVPAPSDSVMEALYRLPGYDVVRYEGTSADWSARDRRLFLWGTEEEKARFFGEGMALEADSAITFDDRERRIRTVGESTFTPDQGEPVASRVMVYDLTEARGTALDARTRYTEQATWYVQGDLTSLEEASSYGSKIRFTSCELEEPHYHFEADRFKVMPGDLLVARSVQMYFGDVPVAYLPFIAQPLATGRSSGLLTPRFSINDVVRTSSGHDRRVSNLGYYWAMSEYSDASLALDWFSNNYLSLTGSLRYRWMEQFLDGRVNFRHFWREDGSRELSMDTGHNWEFDERTRMDVQGRFVSSSDFVREQSFDPREVTQTIDSNAGINRRFDWGTASLTANRQQDLSSDRVSMTLPRASLNLSSRTLFSAPATQASWYNNMSLSGSANFQRRLVDQVPQAPEDFVFRRADRTQTSGRAQSRLGIGNLSLSQSVRFEETRHMDVPATAWGPEVDVAPEDWDAPFPHPGEVLRSGIPAGGMQDLATSDVSWDASANYQHRFFGATTFSPRVGLSGQFRQADTIPEARGFVQGPTRVNLGASFQTEMYGFFPGVGDFETIRHKVTPSVGYTHSPEVIPSDLQRAVFGARELRPRRQITLGFNQTFEAKRRPDDEEAEDTEAEEEVIDEVADPDPAAELDPGAADPDTLRDPDEEDPDLDEEPAPSLDRDRRGPRGQELERRETGDVVTILALRTSSVTYDLVERDETGRFLDGFTTTRLRNTVDSDFLRGLSLSFEHDLFRTGEPAADGTPGARSFAPHLSQLNLSFSMDNRSSLVQFLGGLLGVDPSDDPPATEEEEDDPFEPEEGPDQDQVVPEERRRDTADRMRSGWNADIRYSLRRPRADGPGAGIRAQMIDANLRFAPTENWSATWRTTYDLEERRFNDHVVSLTRDLHRWEATFGFRQTITGNWSFRFEVSLQDNRDLRFDFEQRDLQGGRRLSPGTGLR